MRVSRRFFAQLAFSTCLLPSAVLAQNYPTKPIHIIVPFGAGSTSDVLARAIGKGLATEFGQSVVIDNRPGAGGTIGAAEVARAAPDGYTLVLGTVASQEVAPLMMQKVAYDPIKDFAPITVLADAPGVIAVHSSIPASNVKELIAYLKEHPGTNYSSAGTGTTTHLSGEALKLAAGVSMTHVSYKAVGQAITDLLAGTVKIMFYQLSSLKPYLATHAIKIVGVTSAKRMTSLPDVPTVAEVYPGYDFSAWFGLFAPANTPKPIVDQLYKTVLNTMQTAEFKQLMTTQGLEPSGITPQEFQSFMKIDRPKWQRIIEATGAKPQ